MKYKHVITFPIIILLNICSYIMTVNGITQGNMQEGNPLASIMWAGSLAPLIHLLVYGIIIFSIEILYHYCEWQKTAITILMCVIGIIGFDFIANILATYWGFFFL